MEENRIVMENKTVDATKDVAENEDSKSDVPVAAASSKSTSVGAADSVPVSKETK